ncbi:MAG: hypothetical protein HQK81_14530 [Desulfovibrionaceae bacterium]|nr:hypothetical protein [Desulfovibrionaceae bacterium]MBF0515260.1 hypothetical protein [Desulfovibrionaceae bacterium]
MLLSRYDKGVIYIFSLITLLMYITCISTNYYPTHDAIEWHGIFRYYYQNISHGIIPFWNPYSQTGTPFFPYFQALGLLEPSNLIFAIIGRITGGQWLQADFAHYLFLYLIFILGSYLLMREMSRDRHASFILSSVLFLSCLPNFFRQDGAIRPFAFVPLISFLLIIYFRSNEQKQKKLLLLATYLAAVQSNDYIPVYMLVFVGSLLFLFFIFNFSFIRNHFLPPYKIKKLWFLLLIIFTFCLVTMPVFMFHKEINSGELVPAVRIFQYNSNKLPDTWVSDIDVHLLETGVITERVTIKALNFLSMLIDPLTSVNVDTSIKRQHKSEISLYVGFLPIILSLLAIFVFTRRALMLGFLTIILSFVMSDFTNTQLYSSLPILNIVKTSQNFSTGFLLSLCMLAAIGWSSLKRMSYANNILKAACLVICIKYIIFFSRGITALGGMFSCGAIIFVGLLLFFLDFMKNQKKLKPILYIILIFDFVFNVGTNYIHVFDDGLYLNQRVISNQFSEAINRLSATCSEVDLFPEYKTPYKEPSFEYLHTFFGPELICLNKVVFPNVYIINLLDVKRPLYDSFFMQNSYIDYLIHVNPSSQLIISGVMSPVISFFPEEYAIKLLNKYEIVQKINSIQPDDLNKYIFYENNSQAQFTSKETSTIHNFDVFFKEDGMLQLNEKNLLEYGQVLEGKHYLPHPVDYHVTSFGPNHMSLNASVTSPGFLYYSDGFDRYWRVYVDNVEQAVVKCNLNFKCVYIEAGSHNIVFKYQPKFIIYGIICYFLGSFLFLFSLFFLCRSNTSRP